MTDEELDALLRAARPRTAADAGWAASSDGRAALTAIQRAADAAASPMHPSRPGRWDRLTAGGRAGRPARRRVLVPAALGASVAVAAGVLVATNLDSRPANPSRANRPVSVVPPIDRGAGAVPLDARPADYALAAYDSCAGLLSGLRTHTAAQVTAFGLRGSGYGNRFDVLQSGSLAPVSQGARSAAVDSTQQSPEHSDTNNQEAGVSEPDIVQNDGRRIVSIAGGVLRVVDAAARTITGRLDLGMYAGADTAQLLMSSDRVLVLANSGPSAGRIYAGGPSGSSTTAVLVDLAAAPKIVGTFHTDAGYVDARMVGGTARLVVRSVPAFPFPGPQSQPTDKQRITANRRVVQRAPLHSWLPSYTTTTTDGGTHTDQVPCRAVRHPAQYTGTSLVSVFTIDLASRLTDLRPVTVAVDGGTVYASPTSLFLASSADKTTQLHRFDISRPGAPTYLGSGTVPGQLLNSYSMSQYATSLRVVTTTAFGASSGGTSVYVLAADTLRVTGHVGGLGPGEQLHTVRFLGPLAYVVTFRSVDPLYVLDLRNPAHPRKAAELKITGYSDYLHPVAAGRLLGVGQDVAGGRVTGLQASLFDVTDPARPRRLDRVTRTHTASENPIDPHAFLFWPATGSAVIPIDSWAAAESGAALVVHVDPTGLRTVGTIRNPAGPATVADGDPGIERSLVIGGDLWTLSSGGLAANSLTSLHRRAWLEFG